jgi:putative membrane protein
MNHAHGGGSALLVPLGLAAGAYLLAAGRTSPWRLTLWLLGLGTADVAVLLPQHDFPAHMVGHVLLGMLAPLLMVSGAPVTAALRTLPVTAARRLSRVLRSAPVAVLTHPVTAAVLSVGGLWLLYRTELHLTAPPLLVQVHTLLAGYLMTAALVGRDPVAHRTPLGLRAGVLVIAVAAHNVLAKSLVAAPPVGVPAEQALTGAQVMYYLGAPVEIALFVLLGLEWARRDRRRAVRGRRPPRTTRLAAQLRDMPSS